MTRRVCRFRWLGRARAPIVSWRLLVQTRFLILPAALFGLAALTATAACGGSGQRPSSQVKTPAAQSGTFPARTSDGQPDMQGLWASNMCAGGPCASLNLEPTGYLLSLGFPQRARLGGQSGRGRAEAINNPSGTNQATIIVDPPDHILPYQPWAKARRDAVMMNYLHPSPSEMDSQTRGWPNGIP